MARLVIRLPKWTLTGPLCLAIALFGDDMFLYFGHRDSLSPKIRFTEGHSYFPLSFLCFVSLEICSSSPQPLLHKLSSIVRLIIFLTTREVTTACNYLLHRFLSLNQSTATKQVYAHFTSPTDHQQVKGEWFLQGARVVAASYLALTYRQYLPRLYVSFLATSADLPSSSF